MTEQEMIDAGLLYGIKAEKYDSVSIGPRHEITVEAILSHIATEFEHYLSRRRAEGQASEKP